MHKLCTCVQTFKGCALEKPLVHHSEQNKIQTSYSLEYIEGLNSFGLNS